MKFIEIKPFDLDEDHARVFKKKMRNATFNF